MSALACCIYTMILEGSSNSAAAVGRTVTLNWSSADNSVTVQLFLWRVLTPNAVMVDLLNQSARDVPYNRTIQGRIWTHAQLELRA
jgi:hypothetical protein